MSLLEKNKSIRKRTLHQISVIFLPFRMISEHLTLKKFWFFQDYFIPCGTYWGGGDWPKLLAVFWWLMQRVSVSQLGIFEEQPLSPSFYPFPAIDLCQGQCGECFYPLEQSLHSTAWALFGCLSVLMQKKHYRKVAILKINLRKVKEAPVWNHPCCNDPAFCPGCQTRAILCVGLLCVSNIGISAGSLLSCPHRVWGMPNCPAIPSPNSLTPSEMGWSQGNWVRNGIERVRDRWKSPGTWGESCFSTAALTITGRRDCANGKADGIFL